MAELYSAETVNAHRVQIRALSNALDGDFINYESPAPFIDICEKLVREARALKEVFIVLEDRLSRHEHGGSVIPK